MNSTTCIQRVFDRINYERRGVSTSGNEFKLDTITQLLNKLGNPQRDLSIIHLAGTKGKGSTAKMVAAIGNQLGFKTAVYASPHLVRYTERFLINNLEVCEARLNLILEPILEAVEQLDSEIQQGLDLPPATFFDISTAAAFQLFHEENIELVALEVGLGGRLDSTNVCQPVVSVLTTISLDHMKQLGNTVMEIAAEKAAIIKPSTVVICGDQQPDVAALISDKAVAANCDYHQYGQTFRATNQKVTSSGTEFDYLGEKMDENISGLRLNLLGHHQTINAAVAIRAVTEFCKQIPSVNKSAPAAAHVIPSSHLAECTRKALAEVTIRGRLEVLSNQPLVIADMAHNAVSIDAMITTLKSFPNQGKRQAIFSCAKDKDHVATLHQLSDFFDRIILTQFGNNPRARPAVELLNTTTQPEFAHYRVEWRIEDHSHAALKEALHNVDEYGMTCICGSIFLVGELIDSTCLADVKRNQFNSSSQTPGKHSNPVH
ncbi:MAG: bifunctional folylpolyglutamate synthase/dihydrofolate synthase [Pirellulaceae bacterium]|nr:bifunctional folylpolyglutamate synthase/dihydrofolate synthase [Pirellulaceae bacterium]